MKMFYQNTRYIRLISWKHFYQHISIWEFEVVGEYGSPPPPSSQNLALNATATVPGLSNYEFQKIAEATKDACPVSRALNMQIILDAKLA